MTRRARARLTTLILILTTIVAAPLHAGRGETPVPYHLRVDVTYGEPRGPATVVEDLERELLARLDAAACFLSVDPVSTERTIDGPRLVLHVRLEAFEERLDVEMSIAQRSQNRPPQETAQSQVASVETIVQLDVREPDATSTVRSRRFASRRSWRPLFLEDPAVEARDRLVQEIARTVEGFVCKGSPTKWQRWIERARD